MRNQEKTPIELEAALLRQDHRLFYLIRNWWFGSYEVGDCRRDAIVHAIIWRLVWRSLTTVGFGIAGWLTIGIAWNANELVRQQNELIAKQNELITKQNDIASEAEARSKLPEWLEIEKIDVTESDKGNSFKIDVVVKNNSGKTCVTHHAVAKAQLKTRLPFTMLEMSANLTTYHGGIFPLKLSNEVVEHKLPCLKQLKDGESLILSYEAIRPIMPNIPDTPGAKIASYSWDIKIAIVGANNLAEYSKPVICKFQPKPATPSELDPSIIDAITRP